MYSLEDQPGFLNELVFATSKSGGPGGQNVNKVSSKVELRFDINDSKELEPEHKDILLKKLKNKITGEGVLILTCQEDRSQLVNKEKVVKRFFKLINENLHVPKSRRPTKPTLAARQARLKSKRIHSVKKSIRRGNDLE